MQKTNHKENLTIAIVAGEASGDLLGADLITALKEIYPNAKFIGIAGPQMQAAGCESLFPMQRLSVMGLWEVLPRIPEILKIRRHLIQYFSANRPDIFIGIDAPDFNLPLEKKLKLQNIPTVHYVSPTVWAWRKNRIKTIKKSVDLMLTLFPFETEIYQQNNIDVSWVGHPLADKISLTCDQQQARLTLNLSHEKPIIALLPGSRGNEIHYLGELFLQTALLCWQKNPELEFVVPMVNAERRAQFEMMQKNIASQLPIKIIDNHAQTAMIASDVVLVASGTATLEAMLVKKPMVVAYKISPLTFAIAKRLIKVDHIAIPNLLAGKRLVPEFIQEAAQPEVLADALLNYLNNKTAAENLCSEFQAVHEKLRRNASRQAVHAIKCLLKM